jgi:hypothetical protein
MNPVGPIIPTKLRVAEASKLDVALRRYILLPMRVDDSQCLTLIAAAEFKFPSFFLPSIPLPA